MNKELKKLEEILYNSPMFPDNKLCETTLENIRVDDARLIWKYASEYLKIAKEIVEVTNRG